MKLDDFYNLQVVYQFISTNTWTNK